MLKPSHAWLALSICLLYPGARALAADLIGNGGFEVNGGIASSTFTNWTVDEEAGGGGSWYVQSGTASPFNGIPVLAPPQGSYAAMTDSGGPSSSALLQDFTVPSHGTVTLTFSYFLLDATDGAYDSALGAPPASLDYNDSPNQQARVDILTSSAGAFDLGSSVVYNALVVTPLTVSASACFPAACSYQVVTADLTSYVGSGGTYQLRFSEVDDLGEPLIFGVDNVSIDFTATPTVPEPSPAALLAAAAVCAAFGRRLARRKSQGNEGQMTSTFI